MLSRFLSEIIWRWFLISAEVCKRLFLKKGFLSKAPSHQFEKLAEACAHKRDPKAAVKAAHELHTLLVDASKSVGSIQPPSFEASTPAAKVEEKATKPNA